MDTLKSLLKSQVKAHTRTLKSGQVVNVNAYTDKRTKSEKEPASQRKQATDQQDGHYFKEPRIEDYKKEFPDDPLRFILASTVYGLLEKEDRKTGGYMSNQLGFIIRPNNDTKTMLSYLNYFAKKQYAENKADERKGIAPTCPVSTSNLLRYFKGWLSVGGLNYEYLEDYIKGHDEENKNLIEKQWKYAQSHFSDNPIIAPAKKNQKRAVELTDEQVNSMIEEKIGKAPREPGKPAKPAGRVYMKGSTLAQGSNLNNERWDFYYKELRNYKKNLAAYKTEKAAYDKKRQELEAAIRTANAKKMERHNKRP